LSHHTIGLQSVHGLVEQGIFSISIYGTFKCLFLQFLHPFRDLRWDFRERTAFVDASIEEADPHIYKEPGRKRVRGADGLDVDFSLAMFV
jgi:hypothetical protein